MLGNKGDVLLLGLVLSEDPTVGLHQFAHEQEGIDGGDTVTDETGDEFAFAAGRFRGG